LDNPAGIMLLHPNVAIVIRCIVAIALMPECGRWFERWHQAFIAAIRSDYPSLPASYKPNDTETGFRFQIVGKKTMSTDS
jgi:hypothetical protein